MKMIGHDDELVKQKFPGVAIVCERVDHEFGSRVAPKDRKSLNRDSRDKEGAIRVHHAILLDREENCR